MASVHLRSFIARQRVVDRELREAEVQLDKCRMIIGEREVAISGNCLQRPGALILRSISGIGRMNLAALFCEASGPLGRRDYQDLRVLCGAVPVTKKTGKSRNDRSGIYLPTCNCAAGENICLRRSSVITRAAIPDATRIIATRMN